MHKLMSSYGIPGVTIGIMRGSRLVYAKGYGISRAESERQTDERTLFRVASISKCFCTVCIMTLVDEGRISLDDRIFGEGGLLGSVFPDVDSNQRLMTVRHMLNHSSCLIEGSDEPCFDDNIRYDRYGNPVPTDSLIRYALDRPGTSAPGSYYEYCNLGFLVLHRIVETVTGMDYEDYLKSILAKVGITDTCIGHRAWELLENESEVFEESSLKLNVTGYLNPLRQLEGAAGIITNPTEMMRLLSAIDGDDEVPDILSKESVNSMYTPTSAQWMGLGFMLNDMSEDQIKGAHRHGGFLAGTASFWCGGAKGDWRGAWARPMSGAIICNSRPESATATFYLDGGRTETVDIDDAFYTILTELFHHFDIVYRDKN